MQHIWCVCVGGGGVFYQCEQYGRMLHIILLCAQFSQNVYQFLNCCEELVPIFHGVKFAKYEICGSTKPM